MGIVSINTINNGYVDIDTSDYLHPAINLINDNGYTIDTEEEFTPYFYRNPSYSLLLAGFLKCKKMFGSEIDYLDIKKNWDSHLLRIPYYNKEVEFIKYCQILLFGIISILLYLTLRLVIKPKYAFIISIMFTCFIPMLLFITLILRELLQTTLLMGLNYFLSLYILQGKKIYLIILSLFLAMSVMILHVMIYLLPLIFVFMLFNKRNIVKSIKDCLLIFVMVLLISIPWLLRSYKYSNDYKILKSFGSGLTYEKMAFINANRVLFKKGIINRQELLDVEINNYANSVEGFNKSFNGFYTTKIDSIIFNHGYNNFEKYKISIKDKIKNEIYGVFGIYNFFRFIYIPKLSYNVLVIGKLVAVLFGVMFCFGILVFYKKLFPISFILFAFLIFSVELTGRRLAPMFPLYTVYVNSFLVVLYSKFVKKKSLKESIEEIIQENI
ncbi:MAG: hypothetical protein H8E55_01620 [Pelagibacterales bacterium]|nr:hypothetical protein [Pelagibacterales bacterium]